ncbi:MAG: septal ring lytic transglycosylase RlpA family protein [Gammaproteobacteria bacterium]|nr:MAG: septal ring lytic transglycosylase RlpA family protein [Gammaproteobacteria bacterium]
MPTSTASADRGKPGIHWCYILCMNALGALLVSCSSGQYTGSRYSQAQDSAPYQAMDVSTVKDAVPRVEPKSRYGNPSSYVVLGKRYNTLASSKDYKERGVASWYGTKFHGHRTSSGEPYDMYGMSAAHKTLPLPTYARVSNLRNGRSVIVKINDRGPFHENRIIDLSYAAASRLGVLGKGTGLVEVEAIDPRTYTAGKPVRSVPASQPKIAHRTATTPNRAQPSLYLQLGAFNNRGNAERLRTRLSTTELPGELRITETVSDEKHIFRLRIGPLANVETADRLTRILTDQGIGSPHVVID